MKAAPRGSGSRRSSTGAGAPSIGRLDFDDRIMQDLAVAVRPRTELGCAVHFPAGEGLVYRRKPAKPGPAAGVPDEHDPLMTSGHWLTQRPRLSRGMATIKALRGNEGQLRIRGRTGLGVAIESTRGPSSGSGLGSSSTSLGPRACHTPRPSC